jgi:orotate phosphoribosyltransferase
LNQTLKLHLAKRIESISRLHGEFTLRSGAVSDTYFDKYRFEADPQLLKDICQALVPLLPTATRVLAGLEMGGIPIATVLSQLTGLPTAFLRKEAKSYGTCRYAEGAELPQQGITLVEDVVSSGGAILDAVAKLRADGLQPDVAVCVIDRETGGAEALAAAGVELRALLTMSELTNNPD